MHQGLVWSLLIWTGQMGIGMQMKQVQGWNGEKRGRGIDGLGGDLWEGGDTYCLVFLLLSLSLSLLVLLRCDCWGKGWELGWKETNSCLFLFFSLSLPSLLPFFPSLSRLLICFLQHRLSREHMSVTGLRARQAGTGWDWLSITRSWFM